MNINVYSKSPQFNEKCSFTCTYTNYFFLFHLHQFYLSSWWVFRFGLTEIAQIKFLCSSFCIWTSNSIYCINIVYTVRVSLPTSDIQLRKNEFYSWEGVQMITKMRFCDFSKFSVYKSPIPPWIFIKKIAQYI